MVKIKKDEYANIKKIALIVILGVLGICIAMMISYKELIGLGILILVVISLISVPIMYNPEIIPQKLLSIKLEEKRLILEKVLTTDQMKSLDINENEYIEINSTLIINVPRQMQFIIYLTKASTIFEKSILILSA